MLALLKLDRALAACKTLAKQAWELAGATELVFKKRERLFGWSDAVVRQNGDMFEDTKLFMTIKFKPALVDCR